jgi:3-oxoacyl-[acyl-carrier protein] reductase
MKLENKVVIVTGAVGGIGGEIVKRFVAEGARVLAVDLDQAEVEALADTYGEQVLGVATDVTDYAQVEAMVETWSKRQSIISVRWT